MRKSVSAFSKILYHGAGYLKLGLIQLVPTTAWIISVRYSREVYYANMVKQVIYESIMYWVSKSMYFTVRLPPFNQKM